MWRNIARDFCQDYYEFSVNFFKLTCYDRYNVKFQKFDISLYFALYRKTNYYVNQIKQLRDILT